MKNFKNDEFGDRAFIGSAIITVVGIVIIAVILSLIITSIDTELFELNETSVQAQVVSMEYVEESSSLIPVRMGKTTTYVRQTHPEKFLVTVYYDDVTETFDSEALYQAVETGEEIHVILVQKFRKGTDELVSTWLKLADNEHDMS